MAFLKIADLYDSVEVVAFPKVYTECKQMCQEDSCVVIKGKVSKRNGEVSILLDKAKLLSDNKEEKRVTSPEPLPQAEAN